MGDLRGRTNDLGYFGQSPPGMWFNNLPPFRVNVHDAQWPIRWFLNPSYRGFPALGHTLAWTPATDPDNGYVLTYQFQIATALTSQRQYLSWTSKYRDRLEKLGPIH